MDLGIQGRTAIVCAASKGLGRACAEALAAEGVGIILNARDEAALKQAAAEIAAKHGVTVTPVTADLSTPEGRTAMLREVALLLRRVRDAWVYGGAVNEPMRSLDSSKSTFDRHVDDARSRFREETIRNEQGAQTSTAASEYTPRMDEGAGLILVTFVIAARKELFSVGTIGHGAGTGDGQGFGPLGVVGDDQPRLSLALLLLVAIEPVGPERPGQSRALSRLRQHIVAGREPRGQSPEIRRPRYVGADEHAIAKGQDLAGPGLEPPRRGQFARLASRLGQQSLESVWRDHVDRLGLGRLSDQDIAHAAPRVWLCLTVR